MPKNLFSKYKIILASKSPRRQFLLKELGINFKIRTKEVDESFPKKLKGKQIALYLCKKKAEAFKHELKSNNLLITADTIVWLNNKKTKGIVLNKPADHSGAVKMLKLLSGKMHIVHTGVSITTSPLRRSSFEPSPLPKEKGTELLKSKSFVVSTKVYFKKLTDKEIDFYVRNYKPYDKAGSYGAQESLPANYNPCSKEEIKFLKRIKKTGLIRNSINKNTGIDQVEIIKKITGSYFNVMGLPVKEVYEELANL